MLATRRMHLHWELIRWAVVGLIALLMAMLIARVTGAADLRDTTPGLLPEPAESVAKPLDATTGLPMLVSPAECDDIAMNLWFLLEEHRQNRFEVAIEMWSSIALPSHSEVWRQIALAHAYLHLADTERADAALDEARRLDPENPVAFYLTGLVRLIEASQAEDWYEPAGDPKTVVVSHAKTVRIPVVPNSRSMYELAAMNALESAISAAGSVPYSDELVPCEWPTEAAFLPTVADLLMAIDAEQFAGKAHNVLSYMFLDRGRLESAEMHMDAAANSGLHIVFGYSDLGERYEHAGRMEDAARAYAKAIIHNPHKAAPSLKMLKSLRNSMGDVW